MRLTPAREKALVAAAELAATGLSVRSLAKEAGLSRGMAHWVIKYVRQHGIPEWVHDDLVEDTLDDHTESDGRDLLHDHNYYYNEDTDTYVTFLKVAPKPLVIPGHIHRAMKRAYSNWDGAPATINQICARFEFPRPWFIAYKSIHGWTHDSEPFSNEELVSRDVDDLVNDALQSRRMELFQKFEVKKWNAIKQDAAKWNRFQQEVLERLLESINQSAPDYEVPYVDVGDTDESFVLVLGLTDFHWGSYAWGLESYDSYDRAVAEERLSETTSSVLSRLPGNPREVIIPIGSDFFDVDGDRAATTKGTPQDIDGTPSEILVTGCELMVTYIDMVRQVAPVRLVMMSGNHDRHNGLALLLYLNAWYKDCDSVTVELDYRPRIYLEYGNNLIAFSHGDGSRTKPKDLAAIVATEAREMWGRTENHIAFGGHWHHQKVEEVGGLIHYQLPSLCGADRWHSRNGYTTAQPALQGFMVDEDEGVVSVITSRVRS